MTSITTQGIVLNNDGTVNVAVGQKTRAFLSYSSSPLTLTFSGKNIRDAYGSTSSKEKYVISTVQDGDTNNDILKIDNIEINSDGNSVVTLLEAPTKAPKGSLQSGSDTVIFMTDEKTKDAAFNSLDKVLENIMDATNSYIYNYSGNVSLSYTSSPFSDRRL